MDEQPGTSSSVLKASENGKFGKRGRIYEWFSFVSPKLIKCIKCDLEMSVSNQIIFFVKVSECFLMNNFFLQPITGNLIRHLERKHPTDFKKYESAEKEGKILQTPSLKRSAKIRSSQKSPTTLGQMSS